MTPIFPAWLRSPDAPLDRFTAVILGELERWRFQGHYAESPALSAPELAVWELRTRVLSEALTLYDCAGWLRLWRDGGCGGCATASVAHAFRLSAAPDGAER